MQKGRKNNHAEKMLALARIDTLKLEKHGGGGRQCFRERPCKKTYTSHANPKTFVLRFTKKLQMNILIAASFSSSSLAFILFHIFLYGKSHLNNVVGYQCNHARFYVEVCGALT